MKWNIGLYYAKRALHVPPVRVNQTLCLVPKKAECYLPVAVSGVDVGVQYDPGQECYLSRHAQMGVTYDASLTSLDAKRALGRCAQYASICTRTNSN